MQLEKTLPVKMIKEETQNTLAVKYMANGGAGENSPPLREALPIRTREIPSIAMRRSGRSGGFPHGHGIKARNIIKALFRSALLLLVISGCGAAVHGGTVDDGSVGGLYLAFVQHASMEGYEKEGNEVGDFTGPSVISPWWKRSWLSGFVPVQVVGLLLAACLWRWRRDKLQKRKLMLLVEERTRKLDKRVKELNCLYGISHLIEKQGISMAEVFQGVVNIIPISMPYPEITAARMTLDGREFKTDNFRETRWKKITGIGVNGREVGVLEVCLLEERRDMNKVLFQRGQINLIENVAEQLGRATVCKHVEKVNPPVVPGAGF